MDSPRPTRRVTEVEFVFGSGVVFPVQIDPAVGDTIEFGDREITVRLQPRRALLSDATLPAETIVIMRDHLLAYQTRERLVEELTETERDELRQRLQRSPIKVH